MQQEIKPGEVVCLKSGGPKMTVSQIFEDDENTIARCQWFSSFYVYLGDDIRQEFDKEVKESVFNVESIEKV